MNQIMQGTIVKSYAKLKKERAISFSFPLKGYDSFAKGASLIKKIYERSFIHDFYSVLTSKV